MAKWRGDKWKMNSKEGGSGRGIFYALSQKLPGGTEDNHDSRSPGWDLSSGLPEYEARVFTLSTTTFDY
jgi:hypothetical protein